MAQTFFTNGSTIGFDPSNMSATALFSVGTHTLGSADSEWVYVQAQTTISAQAWVAFNATFSAGMASATDVVNGLSIGVANATISASSFGWIAIRGSNVSALFTGTGSLGLASGEMHLASSAGPTGVVYLGTVGTASCTLVGTTLVATATSSASGLGSNGANVLLVNLVWPRQAST